MGYIDINDSTGASGGGDATSANQVIEIGLLTGINSNILNTNPKVSINQYNEVLSVASGATTSIVTYTVPISQQNILQRVSVSGENIALYQILVNGTPIDSQRTYFGGELNVQFDFTSISNLGTPLNAGDIVTVTVLHNRPYVGNFESRIQMIQVA